MTLTADQQLILDESRRFLAESFPRGKLREFVENGLSTDAELWRNMSQQLGWCAITIAEESGGLGMGLPELSILLELTGGALAPAPLWSTACLATPLIAALKQDELLGRIAVGEIAVSVALPDLGNIDGGISQISAKRNGAEFRLFGTVGCVIDAAIADLILLPVQVDGETALLAMPADCGARIEALPVMDATRPMARISLDGTSLPLDARLDRGGVPAEAMRLALDQARLGLAAEQIGTAAAVMQLTQDYISERVQFGRTIASFQAIKHRCALLEIQLAEARSLAWGAAIGFADLAAEERGMEISALKILADDLARQATREALQMHGGVAMTWEYDLHFYYKRAHVTAGLLGRVDQHMERIATALLDQETAP